MDFDFELNDESFGLVEQLHFKPEGEPFVYYDENTHFLVVICGEGRCNNWARLSIGTMIFKGVDVIQKMYPGDFGENKDTFAGLHMWGGVQNFLSHHYKEIMGDEYETFRVQYNIGRWNTSVAEILDAIAKDKRGFTLPRWEKWNQRIMKALADQNPSVHIPLVPIEEVE